MAEPGRRLAQPAGDDEIAELGRTLNAMLARIETTIAHERAFIDDAAHELRSPLAVLRGELELTADDPGDADAVAQGVASALEETDRLDPADRGPAHAGPRRRRPARSRRRRRRSCSVPPRSASAACPTATRCASTVSGEPVIVRGDASWIHQIVTNLVANAERYARSRDPGHHGRDGERHGWSVADDGAGFPPELFVRAFDRFTRGDGARTRSGGGAGLGLAIVASLADAVGRHGHRHQRAAARRRVRRGRGSARCTVSAHRALTCDVHVVPCSARRTMADSLVGGCSSSTTTPSSCASWSGASSGPATTASPGSPVTTRCGRWLDHHPDVIVLDVMMPHPSGIEVCRHLRADGWTGGVVIVSARSSPADRAAAERAGADVFLAKPFPLDELVSRRRPADRAGPATCLIPAVPCRRCACSLSKTT